MRYFIFTTCLLLLACDNKTNHKYNSETKPTETVLNNEDTYDSTLKESSSITIDSNLMILVRRYRSKSIAMTDMKSHYPFDRDTLYVGDSILVFSYEVNDIIEYIKNRTVSLREPREFLRSLSKADSCYGITTGVTKQTESNMIEVFVYQDPTVAKQAEYWFLKSRDGYTIFPKTLSFAKAIGNNLYVFHSRYMGASWHLKKDFEWFKDTLKL